MGCTVGLKRIIRGAYGVVRVQTRMRDARFKIRMPDGGRSHRVFHLTFYLR